jgi:PTEN phosphatase family protein
VNDWLSSDPSNVIAVHCKGGKGRTGTMICILLVEQGLFEDAVSRSEISCSIRP